MTMLSLSMIVRNEQERLGACLDSVKAFTDEMVVGEGFDGVQAGSQPLLLVSHDH